MSNYKTVFFTLGVLQIILGVSMGIPILIQFFFQELDSSFIGSSIICIIFGLILGFNCYFWMFAFFFLKP